MYLPVTVFLLLLVHLPHVVVVDLPARPEVGLGVGEQFVRAEVDDVEAADLRGMKKVVMVKKMIFIGLI